HARALSALLNPTVNSYKRFGPDTLAPWLIDWGLDNRSAMVRVPPERGPGTRMEVRLGDATANPYLAMAAVGAAVCLGIADKIEPGDKLEGTATTRTGHRSCRCGSATRSTPWRPTASSPRSSAATSSPRSSPTSATRSSGSSATSPTGNSASTPTTYEADADLSASQTRCGEAGMSMCRTPRCATASTIAFCTAGVEPIVPASPMPLAPSGL